MIGDHPLEQTLIAFGLQDEYSEALIESTNMLEQAAVKRIREGMKIVTSGNTRTSARNTMTEVMRISGYDAMSDPMPMLDELMTGSQGILTKRIQKLRTSGTKFGVKEIMEDIRALATSDAAGVLGNTKEEIQQRTNMLANFFENAVKTFEDGSMFMSSIVAKHEASRLSIGAAQMAKRLSELTGPNLTDEELLIKQNLTINLQDYKKAYGLLAKRRSIY